MTSRLSILMLSLWMAGTLLLPAEGAPPASEQTLAPCTAHLEQIGRALEAYQKEQGRLPAHLSDLYPKYLSDKTVFHCPADATSGTPLFGKADPNLPIS